MLRRRPTRIELKLEDLDEWHSLKKETEKSLPSTPMDTPVAGGPHDRLSMAAAPRKERREMVHERIGFNPRPVAPPETGAWSMQSQSER